MSLGKIDKVMVPIHQTSGPIKIPREERLNVIDKFADFYAGGKMQGIEIFKDDGHAGASYFAIFPIFIDAAKFLMANLALFGSEIVELSTGRTFTPSQTVPTWSHMERLYRKSLGRDEKPFFVDKTLSYVQFQMKDVLEGLPPHLQKKWLGEKLLSGDLTRLWIEGYVHRTFNRTTGIFGTPVTLEQVKLVAEKGTLKNFEFIYKHYLPPEKQPLEEIKQEIKDAIIKSSQPRSVKDSKLKLLQ